MVREVTKNPLVTLAELQRFCVGMGETSSRTVTEALCHSRPYGKKDSQTARNKILRLDETKIEMFGLNSQLPVWRKMGITHRLLSTIPAMGVVATSWWGCFSVVGTGRLV